MQFATIKFSQFSQHKMENKLKKLKTSFLFKYSSFTAIADHQLKTKNLKLQNKIQHNIAIRQQDKTIFHTTFQNTISQKKTI